MSAKSCNYLASLLLLILLLCACGQNDAVSDPKNPKEAITDETGPEEDTMEGTKTEEDITSETKPEEDTMEGTKMEGTKMEGNKTEEDMIIEESEYVPAKVIGPDVEPTYETQLATALQAYDNVCYAYAEMQELAEAEDAPKKGKKAAAKLEEKYGDRIAQLAETDLSQLTSEELLSVSTECTNIISAIRDVKIALGAN